MKRLFLIALVLATLLTSVSLSVAQDTTGVTPTTTGPTNTIQFFFVACADQAVANFSGLMLAGFDIFYQVKDASGTALTGLRRVPVNGNYAVSDRVNYGEGLTLGAGTAATADIRIANEGNANTIDFQTTVSDVQDGCSSPQNEVVTSTDLGGGATGGGGAESTDTPQANNISNGLPIILNPDGNEYNAGRHAENEVEIGVRQSDVFRSDTPGLIFAECDRYPRALPGKLYDNDTITIFWSWFARTLSTMQQHLDNANYAVRLNGAQIPNASLKEPRALRNDFYAFYTVPIGYLEPGHYEIEFKLTWNQPISDGYENYGPGTANEQTLSLCNFDVERNPGGVNVPWNPIYTPTAGPVHNLTPQY